jgi:hypothetical protein
MSGSSSRWQLVIFLLCPFKSVSEYRNLRFVAGMKFYLVLRFVNLRTNYFFPAKFLTSFINVFPNNLSYLKFDFVLKLSM